MNPPPSPSLIFAYQALRFLNPAEGYFWAYMAGALLFAILVLLWRRRGRRHVRLGALLRVFGSRKVWLHPSTFLDVKLHLMHGLLLVVAYGALQAGGALWSDAARSALSHLFGAPPQVRGPSILVGAATTAAGLLALELGYWAAHCAFHKVPALWALHKVHHSAEVMTPLTEWRQHPIEFIVFGNVIPLTTGLTYGAMSWLFAEAAPFTLFQVNILLVLHFATFHHLRHSGLWIAATGWLGRLMHSPAHHQIHHSSDPTHFDRNFGYALSVWDWAFGTLHIPTRRGRVAMGLSEAPYSGVVDSLVRPLREAAATVRAPRANAASAT